MSENKKDEVSDMPRITRHNKRITGTRHNDRKFNLGKAAHISQERTGDNVYWQFCKKPERFEDSVSFDAAERYFYEKTFMKALNRQNEKYVAGRHPEKCKTMEQYRKSERTCPEETLYYFGDKDNHANAKTLVKAYNDFQKWHRETFKQIKILDVALHMDEQTPHLHERKVYCAVNKDGLVSVSQTKCLEQMGIQRPEPDKPRSRHNNEKMTYTRMCRDKMIELAKQYGLEVIEQPREATKAGKDLVQYQAEQAQAKLDRINVQIAKKQTELDEVVNNMSRANQLVYRVLSEPTIEYDGRDDK